MKIILNDDRNVSEEIEVESIDEFHEIRYLAVGLDEEGVAIWINNEYIDFPVKGAVDIEFKED